MSILPSLIANAERTNKESSHQRALFCWAHDNLATYPELEWMFAVPNGGERPAPVAAAMVAEGAKDGVLDILLPVRRAAWIGLWIELKRPENKSLNHKAGATSKAQKKWLAYFQSIGYGAMVCYGWEHARDMIVQYLESSDA